MAKKVDVAKNVKAIEKAAPVSIRAKKQVLPVRTEYIQVARFDDKTGDVHGLFSVAGKTDISVVAQYQKLSAADKETIDDFIDLVKSLK